MRTHSKNQHLRLATVFCVLVLAPSALLGWFSLRAVESEQRASRMRRLADQAGDAEFASRAIQQELGSLEATWEALVPRSVGWERHPADLAQGVAAAQGHAFVRDTHLLHVCGFGLADPVSGAKDDAVACDADRAREQFEALTRADAAEVDAGNLREALAEYETVAQQAQLPALQAMALAGMTRIHIRQQDWDAALVTARRITTDYANVQDLDNRSLRLHAKRQVARALEGKGELDAAAATLVDVYADLLEHSDEIGTLQFEILADQIAERVDDVRVRAPGWSGLAARWDAVRQEAKKPVGRNYFARKLMRKLVRSVLAGQAYSTRLSYISDATDGTPFLLAYLFLPDSSGTRVSGIVGLTIDLPSLSQVLLPEILRGLEMRGDVTVAVVDEAGQRVIGSQNQGETILATVGLGVPFDFWRVAVVGSVSDDGLAEMDFRTKVFLYFVLVLLVAIVAGSTWLVQGLRRESRLAQLKTSFVSNVSHELRTPLTSIRMYSEMLEIAADEISDGERARYLKTIRRECDRLRRLIDAVLDFARIDRGTKQYTFEYEEIGPLVHAIGEDFRTQAEAAGFEYHVEIEPGLPEARVDADAIRQMLLNLLSNALKYADDERYIALRALRREGMLAIQVEDHGIGIARQEQERIFQDFYRVDTLLTSERSGVGLGLTLARRIAEAHDGRIRVDSKRGQGSTFTVLLPDPEAAQRQAGPGRDLTAEVHGG